MSPQSFFSSHQHTGLCGPKPIGRAPSWINTDANLLFWSTGLSLASLFATAKASFFPPFELLSISGKRPWDVQFHTWSPAVSLFVFLLNYACQTYIRTQLWTIAELDWTFLPMNSKSAFPRVIFLFSCLSFSFFWSAGVWTQSLEHSTIQTTSLVAFLAVWDRDSLYDQCWSRTWDSSVSASLALGL